MSLSNFQVAPIFHCVREDLPMHNNAVFEAQHVAWLWEVYAEHYNAHPSPYNEDHPDVLHRALFRSPDIDSMPFLDVGTHYAISLSTGAALRNAARTVRIKLGEAVIPSGWDRSSPWLTYNFEHIMMQDGFPYIPEPEGVMGEDALKWLVERPQCSLQIRRKDPVLDYLYWAIADIYGAYNMRTGSNLLYVGYYRHSPALISAHRHYLRLTHTPIDMYCSQDPLSQYDSDSDSEPGGDVMWYTPQEPHQNLPSLPCTPSQDPDVPFDAERWAATEVTDWEPVQHWTQVNETPGPSPTLVETYTRVATPISVSSGSLSDGTCSLPDSPLWLGLDVSKDSTPASSPDTNKWLEWWYSNGVGHRETWGTTTSADTDFSIQFVMRELNALAEAEAAAEEHIAEIHV